MDAIKSEKNVGLLKRFALRQLLVRWKKLKSNLVEAINLVIGDCIDETIEPRKNWSLTHDNLCEINILIWKKLKPRVEKIMNGTVQDPEEELDTMLNMKNVFKKEEPADNYIPERSHNMDFENSWA